MNEWVNEWINERLLSAGERGGEGSKLPQYDNLPLHVTRKSIKSALCARQSSPEQAAGTSLTPRQVEVC